MTILPLAGELEVGECWLLQMSAFYDLLSFLSATDAYLVNHMCSN